MHEIGFNQSPKNAEVKSPFEYTHNSSFFEFLTEHEKPRKDFDDYMASRRQGLVVWHETFPMASRLGLGVKQDPEAVLLVDVGGSWGHDVQSFHDAHPTVPGRLILQDLPVVIDKVKSRSWLSGIELMRYDFFTVQPVQGQSYPFRRCIIVPRSRC